MIAFVTRLFARGEPALTEAGPRDAVPIAKLHGVSFHRGWSDGDVERMLRDPNVIAHRALIGRSFAGFILSRVISGEAEILSIAVATARRGKGIAEKLLGLHLRRLAGVGTRSVFLEVEENNIAARRLYRRAGFREVGRREGYYRDAAGKPSAALVLRCDLP